MSWILARGGTSPRWVKWVDEAAARAHLGVLAYVLDHAGAIESEPFETQLRRTRELFEGLRGFALSVDLDPLDAAPYSAARLSADAGTDDQPGLYVSEGSWRRAAWDAVQAQSPEVRDAIASGDDVHMVLWPRVDLSGASDDRGVIVRGEIPDTPQGTDLTRASGSSLWSDFGWREWHPGLLEATHTHEVGVLLPLRLSWELGAACARELLALGLEASVSLSVAWIGARNVRLAVVLNGSSLPASVIEAAAELDTTAFQTSIDDETKALFATLAGIAAAVTPVAGLVVGLMLGLETLLEQIFGRAVVRAVDVWGRRQPFLARVDYRGTILEGGQAPTQAAPPPIFYVASYAEGLGFQPYRPLIAPKSSSGSALVKVGVGLVLARILLGG